MEKSESRVLGILGAFLGGLLATLPWILVYVYGNMMFSALAIIIAFVALKGYKLFHGKQDKYLAITIAIISIMVVSIATFIIIPFWLLAKEGFEVSFTNFSILYSSEKFTAAIFRDYVISVLFTVLGISGIVKTLKEQHGSVFSKRQLKDNENK